MYSHTREMKARQFGFDSEYVVEVTQTFPSYNATTGFYIYICVHIYITHIRRCTYIHYL
jgi:hypothetical protein